MNLSTANDSVRTRTERSVVATLAITDSDTRARVGAALAHTARQVTVGAQGSDVLITDCATTARNCADRTVLVLPATATRDEVSALGRTGIGGFIDAESLFTELVPAVLSVGRGLRWVSPVIGARLLQGPPPQLPPLTGRECQVLDHIAEGHSNVEIAESLVISVRTVKHHVTNVLMKLGARDRAHAVALALRFR
ncbi:response regulator transcription factor [Amycolatopsis sp. NPDC049691]|uniref:response regulator transcription factor n=1 Tax=Amycolatopsis sp. NPDC049691 TaxID=3155155 RepID=UPI003429DADE